jgi:AcrR family transcriptional regulator
MGRRPRFTVEEVQDAALAVLDERGVTGLTVRAVAERLGTGAMTLYTYMDTHSDLSALAVDGTLRHVAIPRAPHPDWRDDVRAICHAVWRVVRVHPHAIPLILARRSRSPHFLDIAEALLAALARSGRSGHDLLIAFRAVTTLATAFAQTEIGGALSTGAGSTDAAAVIDQFSSLDVGAYRRLVEIAEAAATSDPESEFLRSLDALLAGLDVQSHASPAER